MKTWAISHTHNDKWYVSVEKTSFWIHAIDFLIDFSIHGIKILKYIPTPPIPFVHKNKETCENSSWHFHFFNHWFGSDLELVLCSLVCIPFSLFSVSRQAVLIKLTKKQLEQLCETDKRTRDFVEEMRQIDIEITKEQKE